MKRWSGHQASSVGVTMLQASSSTSGKQLFDEISEEKDIDERMQHARCTCERSALPSTIFSKAVAHGISARIGGVPVSGVIAAACCARYAPATAPPCPACQRRHCPSMFSYESIPHTCTCVVSFNYVHGMHAPLSGSAASGGAPRESGPLRKVGSKICVKRDSFAG